MGGHYERKLMLRRDDLPGRWDDLDWDWFIDFMERVGVEFVPLADTPYDHDYAVFAPASDEPFDEHDEPDGGDDVGYADGVDRQRAERLRRRLEGEDVDVDLDRDRAGA